MLVAHPNSMHLPANAAAAASRASPGKQAELNA